MYEKTVARQHSINMDPPSLSMYCYYCRQPTANLCIRCHGTAYCDQHCQGLDWSGHKDDCEDLQLQSALDRVSKIVHLVYSNFRKSMWNTPVMDLKQILQTLVACLDDESLSTAFLTPFSGNLVNSSGEEWAKNAH